MPDDPRRLADARKAASSNRIMRLQKRKAEQTLTAAKREVAAQKEALATLEARGGAGRKIQGAQRAVRNAEARFKEAMDQQVRSVRDLERQQKNLSEVLAALRDPASTLAGDVPVLLLPARIETRFMQGELRVRVYPDTVHVDQLEPLPTEEEAEAARAYWLERWVTRSEAEVGELWARHTAQRPVNRFAYLVETFEPPNLDQMGSGEPEFPEVEIREPGPSRAPTAALLPSRWVVVGYRGDREVLRVTTRTVSQDLPVGPAPDDGTDEPEELPDDQDVLALDEASRWIADYDEAVVAGMAVTIGENAVEGGLGEGLDLLVVLGVDVGDEPEETAAELTELLEAHRATTGLGFVAPGTPTNATGDTVPTRPLADDPTTRAREPIPGSAAEVAAEALGVAPDSLLGIGGAGDAVNPLTGHLHTAIWEPTLGYFLRQMLDPLAEGVVADDVRTHFRQWVRPRGPLPTLRIGRQPLGLLPVVALDGYKGGHRGEQTVANVLRQCRYFWDLGDAGRIGDSGDPTADLVELLSRTDRSVAVRVREALGPGFMANSVGAEPMMEMQEALAAFALILMGVTERAAIVDVTLLAEEEVLPVPLVTGTPSEASLAPDYVARIRAEVRRTQGFVRLTADPDDASTLLEALLIQAAQQEIARAGTSLVLDELQITLPLDLALRDEELHLSPNVVDRLQGPLRVESEGTAGARLSVKPVELMKQEVAAVARGKTVADHLASQQVGDLLQDLRTRQLGEFREALTGLVGAPSRELDRTMAEALDALSHRYDAWATSLATRRIAELRGRGVKGLHIGAYGWVEDLRPATDRESAGYIHGPSIAHATTAAILRSGHLARRGTDEREPLAIDLSSARAATAQRLLDGLRQGQSVEALLGYRFERALRDLGPRFAAYVRSIRLQHPLPEDTSPETTGPVEEVAARNVVDGLALAELDPAGRTALLEAAGVPEDDRADVTGELVALSDALDAVGDLLMAESVFQAVLGNVERAAAALDVLDRQGPIPEPGVLKTPRTGSGQGHRVLLSLDHQTPPPPWRRLTDVRSMAAPRVNAWVARVLGDPEKYRFHAEVLDTEGSTVEVVSVGLADLGLSPLSLALAAGRGAGEGSELEQRLGVAFAKMVGHPAAASLRALPEPPADAPAGTEGLGVLLDAAARIAELLSAARPAGIEDLLPDTERPVPAPDIEELKARADGVRAKVEALASLDPTGATQAALVRGLEAAAALGLPGMLPVSDDRDALEAQLRRGVTAAVGMLAALDEIEAAPGESPHAELIRETARIRAVLGEDQPVVPLLNLSSELRTELSGSAADPGLLDGAVLAPTEWLLARARVRPAVSRLWEVLAAAELRGTGVDPTQLTVTQVPWSPGERWLGLPTPPTATPGAATASLVLHRAGLDDATAFPARFAALVVDQWQEQIPSHEETTGIAFHYDGPGARAPQAALLAAPAAPDQAAWSTDGLLATVREAVELTRIRALDLDDLTAVGRFLPAVYLAFDLERQVPSLDFSRLIEQALVRWRGEWKIP